VKGAVGRLEIELRRLTMKLEPQITFRNAPHSEEMESRVREKVAKLDEFCDQIMGCRVVLDMPHQHHRKGSLYDVRIDLTVPGEEIAVNREPAEHTDAKEFDVALRDAFDSAGCLLEDYVRRRRQQVKRHDGAQHARVRTLVPHADHGFLETVDGREVYFHRNSVLNARFDDLVVGTEVTFVEEQGDRGPQASTVKVVGRHHHA
jgi:cold shock CspA family protein